MEVPQATGLDGIMWEQDHSPDLCSVRGAAKRNKRASQVEFQKSNESGSQKQSRRKPRKKELLHVCVLTRTEGNGMSLSYY